MPTTPLNITSAWTKAADGPVSVLIPAITRFSFCVTNGSAPALSPAVCPSREGGEELSCALELGESLWITADQSFSTSVTSDA